jgi:hypothetical protein
MPPTPDESIALLGGGADSGKWAEGVLADAGLTGSDKGGEWAWSLRDVS